MWIFLLLIAVPIIEIALFIELGGAIGLWPTIGLVIGTAILGGALLRAQGFAAMARLQSSLAEGGDPRGPMAHGVMILAAGLLMLTPGFFTDTVGFLLLVPPVRSALIGWLGPRLARRAVFVGPMGARGGAGGARRDDGPIEAEYMDVSDLPDDDGDAPAKDPTSRSGWARRMDDDGK